MASLIPGGGRAEQPRLENRARILLVNKDPRELVRYQSILQSLGCQVRASSSFEEGMQYAGRDPFDLIILDQGSGAFEGQKVLAQAMEVDLELRVLILAQSYNKGCHLEAMQSGALDYLEGPLSAAEVIALLETFMPRRNGARGASLNRVKGGRSNRENMSRAKSN
jgi:DNA-binding response OmpR family regulator